MTKKTICGSPPKKSGSVMLECVMALPLIMLLIFACMQIAHLWVARQVTLYAAFSAARAMLSSHETEYLQAAQQAAEQICAWAVIGQAAAEPEKILPGWGRIPGSGSTPRKTRVVVESGSPSEWNVKATVEFDFGLVMPVVGPIIGWGLNPWRRGGDWGESAADRTGNRHRYLDTIEYPHVRFSETVALPKPFVTLTPMGIPSGGW